MSFLGSSSGLLSKGLGFLEGSRIPKNSSDDTPTPFAKRKELDPGTGFATGSTKETETKEPIDLTDEDIDDEFIDKFKGGGRTTTSSTTKEQPSESKTPPPSPVLQPIQPVLQPIELPQTLESKYTTHITHKILKQHPVKGSKSFISTDKQNLETLHKSFINVYEKDDKSLLKKYGI